MMVLVSKQHEVQSSMEKALARMKFYKPKIKTVVSEYWCCFLFMSCHYTN